MLPDFQSGKFYHLSALFGPSSVFLRLPLEFASAGITDTQNTDK